MATGQWGFQKKMWQRGNPIFETSVARATGQWGVLAKHCQYVATG